MWKLVILLLPFWFFSVHLFAFPLDVRSQPPVPDPVLPTEKEPILPSSSSFKPAQSPDSGIRVVVHHQDLNKKILIALVLSASFLGGILLLLSCFWIYRLKKKKNLGTKGLKSLDSLEGIPLGALLDKFPSVRSTDEKGSIAVIEFPILVAATRNFHEDNVLGEGGLGRVYRAKFSDNVFAAVKKLHGRWKDVDRELENEVDLQSKIRHQNIVALLGYCLHNETQFLIYEMMQNGSLESQLHGSSHGSKLSWHLRMKIALDIARGLEYLHERLNPPVIHRDLKSSNILLDSNFNAKITDLGLAFSYGNSNRSNVKLSGTLGYVAPEYLLDGKLTDKSDVYAFGVVLLELLMGRKPVEKIGESHFRSIVTWAMPQLTDREKLPNIVDPVIRNTMDPKHLYQVAAVAVLCVQPEPSYRPLITDVLHSFIPLVPVELGGSLKIVTDT